MHRLIAFVQLHALVHVVQQLHLVAERRAQVSEQLRQHAYVGRPIPRSPAGWSGRSLRRPSPPRFCVAAARPVGREPGHAALHAHVAEARRHALACVVLDLLEVAAARVVVAVRAVADLAAEQLVERQAGALAENVPQRDVDAAHRVEQHRAVAPVAS